MCAVPQLSDLDLKGIDTVAVDLETYDPNLKQKGLVQLERWFCLWHSYSYKEPNFIFSYCT